MTFEVFVTDDAARDLDELDDFIQQQDGWERAGQVLDEIEKIFAGLSELPERGACPKELLDLGIREFREVFYKPYRIIYRVLGLNVYVLLIVDGRRDLQAVLQRRLLAG
jgi:toxin ParE1/3/4